MIIAICASFAFYSHVSTVEDDLTSLGHDVRVPETAKAMKLAGDFNIDPLVSNEMSIIALKTEAIRQHFGEITSSDAILVVNDEKHGQVNYIGPNVLMEMGVAFALNKRIYILNELPKASPFISEIEALQPIVLLGNLRTIE